MEEGENETAEKEMARTAERKREREFVVKGKER